jgi:hypothetical protein
MVFADALNTILADPKWANMQVAMTMMTIDAPLWRVLKGDHLTADAYERDARNLAARFNVRLGQIMKSRINAITPYLKQVEKQKPPAETKPEYEFHPDPESGRLVRVKKGATANANI